MWNQILSPPKTQYYSYSSKRKQQLAKLSKYKLFILIITRATYRVIKDSISQIQKVTSQQSILLDRVWTHMNRHAYTAQKATLQKLKENVVVSRARQNTIKNTVILLERMEKYKVKKTFATLVLFAQRKNQLVVSNIEHMRKIIFCRKIQKVFVNKKKEHLLKMLEYSRFMKKLHKKVKLAGIIGKQYIKHVKQACFNRLTKHLFVSIKPNTLQSPHNVAIKEQAEKKNLQKRLNDMESELQTRNASICRLEQQILQLKMQQPTNNNYNSFSEYTTYNGNTTNNNISYRQQLHNNRSREISREKRGQNESQADSGFDFSLGSILGNSFSLNKSRSRDMRKGDSIASMDCNCSYKEKYIKSKNTCQSLKNQLQIVKEELQVAKDLNDHFTNEIRQYFGGQKDSIQLDRLKKEIKDLQKEREQMRMKITKYQHHITTLKSEFKIKIQELYRKVKKER